MTTKIMYWMSVSFSVIALLLFVTNTSLINNNRKLQDDVNHRQSAIASGNNLTPLNQKLAQALAEVAVKEDDKDIADLLAAQGIVINKKADAESVTPKAVKKNKSEPSKAE